MLTFAQHLFSREHFAWHAYPTLLSRLGFRNDIAAYLTAREVVRQRTLARLEMMLA
jgi:hypothetical protein